MKLKLWCLGIFISAVSAIYAQSTGESDVYAYLKALTTILIIMLAVSFAKTNDTKFKTIIIVGLVFCLVGDLLLLNQGYFVAGLAAFLIAHLIFAYGFYSLNNNQLQYKLFLLLFLIGFAYFLFLQPSLGEIAIPVALYIFVIVVMTWQAVSLYCYDQNKAYLMMTIGAVLFLISDSILAFDKFVTSFSLAGVLILLTYWMAISLFAYSAISLRKSEVGTT